MRRAAAHAEHLRGHPTLNTLAYVLPCCPTSACCRPQANIPPVPQLLLHQALQRGVHAIIDAGALLAGVNLRCVCIVVLCYLCAAVSVSNV